MDILVCATRCQKISVTCPSQQGPASQCNLGQREIYFKKTNKKPNQNQQINEPKKSTNNKPKQNSGQKYSAYRNISKKQ